MFILQGTYLTIFNKGSVWAYTMDYELPASNYIYCGVLGRIDGMTFADKELSWYSNVSAQAQQNWQGQKINYNCIGQ